VTILVRSLTIAALAACAPAGAPPVATAPSAPSAPSRDGQRDFDFELGTWQTRISRLPQPLTGSTTWVEYAGTTVVREVWGGRANLVELVAEGPAGRLELLSLRLYDPATRQWSLHVASSRGGGIGPPVVGHFDGGRGRFLGRETIDGRDVLVRFEISDITPTSCRFEQAFSPDGGATWEVNWIATDTR
jgi:hypothetical protein